MGDGAGGGDSGRRGPNRGSRQRPNPRDSIKKLARAAGGEAKPGDLYYEDRLFKTARLAARPPSRRPRGHGRSPGGGGCGGCGGPGPTGGGEKIPGDLPGGVASLAAFPERGGGQTFLERQDPLPPLGSPCVSQALAPLRACPGSARAQARWGERSPPRAGRAPVGDGIAADALHLIPLRAKRQANTECPVTQDLITAECILHAD